MKTALIWNFLSTFIKEIALYWNETWCNKSFTHYIYLNIETHFKSLIYFNYAKVYRIITSSDLHRNQAQNHPKWSNWEAESAYEMRSSICPWALRVGDQFSSISWPVVEWYYHLLSGSLQFQYCSGCLWRVALQCRYLGGRVVSSS